MVSASSGNSINSSLAVKRHPLGMQVAEALRQLIRSGRFQPGDRLIETEIAQMLAVSRGPVREAISILVAEGLVRHSPGVGASIAQPTIEDVRALIGLRVRMEEYAIESAATRVTPDLISLLRTLAATVGEAACAGDLERTRQVDLEFHQVIWNACGSDLLAKAFTHTMSPLFVWQVAERENWRRYSYAAHISIVEALEVGDAEAAKEAFRKHLRNAWGSVGAPGLE